MSILLLICIIIICRILSKKLSHIASFFYDKKYYSMMHNDVVRESLIDIKSTLHRIEDNISEEPVLESYTKLVGTEQNIQNARKELAQDYIIKKAIRDELNI
jgi:hypothetical protein